MKKFALNPAMFNQYVTIRFYEELNDFIPVAYRKQDLFVPYSGQRSVKDLIESCGVPHVEVDLILVNGKSIDFNYRIKKKDRVSVYPVFESMDITGVTRLRSGPLRGLLFVADVHLAKLVKNLRLLGFDVDYCRSGDHSELADISQTQNRILLTGSRQLLMRKNITRAIAIHSTEPLKQTVQVLKRLDLWETCRPFTRCILCNEKIFTIKVDNIHFKKIKSYIPERVLHWCKTYYQCNGCKHIYWKGSHYKRLKDKIEKILSYR